MRFPVLEIHKPRDLVRAGRKRVGQLEPQRNALLLARGQVELLLSRGRLRQCHCPGCFAMHRLARVVDHDELLFEGLAGKENVIFARESVGLAGDISQQRPVVAQQGLSGGGGQPIFRRECQIQALDTRWSM